MLQIFCIGYIISKLTRKYRYFRISMEITKTEYGNKINKNFKMDVIMDFKIKKLFQV